MSVVPEQKQAGFPFVIEPVLASRVQFWAQYAAQALTQDQMSVVVDVFHCLWYEVRMSEHYQKVLFWVENGGVPHVLGWLDLVFAEALELASEKYGWPRVLGQLQRILGEAAQADPWYQDVFTSFRRFDHLCVQLVEYVLALCAVYHLALPEHVQAFLQAGDIEEG